MRRTRGRLVGFDGQSHFECCGAICFAVQQMAVRSSLRGVDPRVPEASRANEAVDFRTHAERCDQPDAPSAVRASADGRRTGSPGPNGRWKLACEGSDPGLNARSVYHFELATTVQGVQLPAGPRRPRSKGVANNLFECRRRQLDYLGQTERSAVAACTILDRPPQCFIDGDKIACRPRACAVDQHRVAGMRQPGA
ncbi:hypothetical protein ACVWXO_009662 [Bradyrhizobium sp. LM2.7]